MRVVRFLKHLINPEIDRTEDRLTAQVAELVDDLPLSSDNDSAPRGKLIATEEERREAGTEPAEQIAHESREEAARPRSGAQQEPQAEPEPEPLPESEGEGQLAAGQAVSPAAAGQVDHRPERRGRAHRVRVSDEPRGGRRCVRHDRRRSSIVRAARSGKSVTRPATPRSRSSFIWSGSLIVQT